jgi:hypothetical protein
MQNIDYSRRLRGASSFPHTQAESTDFGSYFSTPPARESQKPKSAFVLLIGAILLFTSGMVVGIQLNQKEKGFASNQEKSFSNVGKTTRASEAKLENTESSREEEGSLNTNSGFSIAKESSPFPTTLKFPPKNDQINYMVQIGNFPPEDAIQVGKQLMLSEPSLQGRIFRTSTGKLYAGYFYRMEDARDALDKITTKLPNASDAMVKTIRF